MRFYKKIALSILFLTLSTIAFAQEDEYWNKLLNEEVEIENPVYKPVISLGAGVLSFFGDVKNPGSNLLSGKNGFKLNVSTFVGKKNMFKGNVFAIFGSMSGHDFNISRKMQMASLPVDGDGNTIFPNSSFSTEFYQVGLNLEYGFGHLIKDQRKFRPFISIGFSPIIFSPKGDWKYKKAAPGTSVYYHYWSDGTIRDFDQNSADAFRAKIRSFDNDYETDLSSAKLFRKSSYSQNSFSIPLEIGFDFFLSYRVSLRVSTAINYTFTDNLDNYNSEVAENIGLKDNGYNDIFTFTHFTMNFDLFSEKKTITIEKMFADLENVDYDIILADQDGDGILDLMDLCPDTPTGVAMDTTGTGCPLDSDKDGIYDYMDEEASTPAGATIDEKGVQIPESKLEEMFEPKNAVFRKEIRVIPVAPIWTRSITFTPGVIPDKFKKVDTDGDGYISFPELLKSVDDYFDEKTEFKPEDIYELNSFFFSQ